MSILSVARFVFAAPIAVPLIIVGVTVGSIVPPVRAVGIFGIKLLGLEIAR